VKIIEVAAGLIFHHGKLLIAQRFAGAHLGGLWEFPGGKLEGGESFECCLIRELREELGIEVAVGESVEDLTHEYPAKTVRLRFFRCSLQANSPAPKAIGCAAFAWISPADLSAYEFPAADARLLQKLATSPEWWRSSAYKAG